MNISINIIWVVFGSILAGGALVWAYFIGKAGSINISMSITNKAVELASSAIAKFEKEREILMAGSCDRNCGKRRSADEHCAEQLLIFGSAAYQKKLFESKIDPVCPQCHAQDSCVERDDELTECEGLILNTPAGDDGELRVPPVFRGEMQQRASVMDAINDNLRDIIELHDDFSGRDKPFRVLINEISYDFIIPVDVCYIRLAIDEENKACLLYSASPAYITLETCHGRIYPVSMSEIAQAVTDTNAEAAESVKDVNVVNRLMISTKKACEESIGHDQDAQVEGAKDPCKGCDVDDNTCDPDRCDDFLNYVQEQEAALVEIEKNKD